MNRVLINALGIENSGGLNILRKTLDEISSDLDNQYYCEVYNGKYVVNLINDFALQSNIFFSVRRNYGNVYRLIYENINFPRIIRRKKINLIYNLSGSSQFFTSVKCIVKVQNLLFFTKSLDTIYFNQRLYYLWFRQIFMKRLILLPMLKRAQYIEIQSNHVKDELSNFLLTNKKTFFLKNDFISNKVNYMHQKYNFYDEITFLYIVGPHFEMPHKNFSDFVKAMILHLDLGFKFRIKITLSAEQLHQSDIWDKRLDKVTSFLGYIEDKKIMKGIFKDNSILVSTSAIETLGLHVIDAIVNGIICIVPKEPYSYKVYGDQILTYNLFNPKSLCDTISELMTYDSLMCNKLTQSTQEYIGQNESKKYKSSTQIFDAVLLNKA